MTDETPPPPPPTQPEQPQQPTKPVSTVDQIARGAKAATDTAGTVVDTANNAFSAIKWVAIAVVVSVIGLGGLAAYKVVSAPAKAIGDVAGGVSDAVKSGAGSVKSGASDVMRRRVIPAPNVARLNTVAEAAFLALTTMPVTPPDGVKARVFATKNFPGSDGRLCALSLSFGGDAIPVFVAADNKGYATAKSLGAKTDRLIRTLIRADGDDIGMITEWDGDIDGWVMKWKASTIKKPLSDADAAARFEAVLQRAAQDCGG